MPQQRSEARRYPRIKSDIRVRALAPPDKPALESFGRGFDISEGGMAIYVPMTLAPQQEILVVFEVPLSRQKVGIRASVRYVNDNRYGLEFQRLREEDRARLRSALYDLALIHNKAPENT